jgi:hypothetical protein
MHLRFLSFAGATSIALLVNACGSSPARSTAPDGGSSDARTEMETGSPPPLDSGTGDATSDVGAHVDASPMGDAGGPITGLPTEMWTWVPFPEAHCRDGSTTGIGVNLNPASSKLMIFLEGGGACFNALTCSENPANFGQTAFTELATGTADFTLNAGILDRTNAANPVQDWSFVYIPYCTGDVHAGNNVATIAGANGGDGGVQMFVGYVNMTDYLTRIVPTFPTVSQVLLAGMSGGGFGVAVNYPQVAKAFGSTPVAMLDDSGPFMEDPYLATCLQSSVRTLWGLDSTATVVCGAACSTPSSYFLDYAKNTITTYPSAVFGLADSTDDDTISVFFGFGFQNCMSFQQLTGTQFTAGLQDIRTQLAASPNFGAYVFSGTDHTSIQSASFYTRVAGGSDGGTGVLMTDWVAALVNGTVTNAGP